MKFIYNPRILKQLGTELITSDEIAITELIKNSYDAGAKKVNVHFADSLEELSQKHLEYPIHPLLYEMLQHKRNEPSVTKKHTIRDTGEGELIFTNLMVIEDTGRGMDLEKIEKGFFVVGTTIKREEKRKKQDGILLGDKGIGRLSAQRISPILILESKSKDDQNINAVKIEWDAFIKDNEAETEDIEIPKNDKTSYTRLWLIGTDKKKIKFNNYFRSNKVIGYDLFGNPILSKKPLLFLNSELEHALSFLFSPFEEGKPIIDVNFWYNDQAILADFYSETLKIAETQHSFSLTEEGNNFKLSLELKITPWFLQRIHRRLVGKKLYQDWGKEPIFYGELLKKYEQHFKVSLSRTIYIERLIRDKTFAKGFEKVGLTSDDFIKNIVSITPVKGKVYSFKRDGQLLRMAINSALAHNFISENSKLDDTRNFLNKNNGIKLYRNKHRIGTIGNNDDDWLKLQQERTKGQQFYRFELGNIIGYVDINDPLQDFISETSSRQRINDNVHYKSLFLLIDFIFNHRFYDFNRSAVEISKNIFDEEGLIPKNTEKEVQEQAEKTRETIEVAKANIKAFQKAFELIRQNINMDSEEQINNVKEVLISIEEQTNSFDKNFKDTLFSLEQTERISKVIELRKQEIETEAYNNYKLMANGLITEVITHELHSLVSRDQQEEKAYNQFEEIKKFLFHKKRYDLNKNYLHPLRDNYQNLLSNIKDISTFYQFLEKTFLYKGNKDDYEIENLNEFLLEFSKRFNKTLSKNNIIMDFENTNIELSVPRGSLVHIFYNLIDNSIHWIKERQRREQYDKIYDRKDSDKITITKINNYTIRYFDSGTGVLNQYQHILFNPLISGKNNGRGMGLYIIRNFLESFGANIALLEDRNDYGNRFIFEINFKNNQET